LISSEDPSNRAARLQLGQGTDLHNPIDFEKIDIKEISGEAPPISMRFN